MVRLPLGPTLFPYTTLFRSRRHDAGVVDQDVEVAVPLALVREGQAAGDVVRGDAERVAAAAFAARSEEHTSELQSQFHLVCRRLLEQKKQLHAAFFRLGMRR